MRQAGLLSIEASSELTLQYLYSLPASGSMSSRVEFYARVFADQKIPYMVDPLGEGERGEFNNKPLYRFDGFDCTTFVETVIALALSRNADEFKDKINRVRYKDGIVSMKHAIILQVWTGFQIIPKPVCSGHHSCYCR